MSKLKVAILITGRGSNMEALALACRNTSIPAQIELVLSNNPTSKGLKFAQAQNIKTEILDHRNYDTREEFDAQLTQKLKDSRIELVCLAGFMRILGPKFVRFWHNRVINIHPSLLPAFKGLNVHERVIESGARITGCTVHFVSPRIDTGPIIAQAALPVLDEDNKDTLAAKVLRLEHQIYPLALKYIAEQRVRVIKDKVFLDRNHHNGDILMNPSR